VVEQNLAKDFLVVLVNMETINLVVEAVVLVVLVFLEMELLLGTQLEVVVQYYI
jgi:hypothetical protein